jgi:hypothetical protein
LPTYVIAILFVLMIVAPCLLAHRTSQPLGDHEEPKKAVAPRPVWTPAARPASLGQIAAEAELEATLARYRASEAHRVALMATARAAALRADLAAEVAVAAERAAREAIRVAETEVSRNYLRTDYRSLSFPQERTAPRRAA